MSDAVASTSCWLQDGVHEAVSVSGSRLPHLGVLGGVVEVNAKVDDAEEGRKISVTSTGDACTAAGHVDLGSLPGTTRGWGGLSVKRVCGEMVCQDVQCSVRFTSSDHSCGVQLRQLSGFKDLRAQRWKALMALAQARQVRQGEVVC